MAPLRVSTTKSEWLPDDPTAFVPTRLWKLPFITTWDDSRNQNRPTDSAEEALINSMRAVRAPRHSCDLNMPFCFFRIGEIQKAIRPLKNCVGYGKRVNTSLRCLNDSAGCGLLM